MAYMEQLIVKNIRVTNAPDCKSGKLKLKLEECGLHKAKKATKILHEVKKDSQVAFMKSKEDQRKSKNSKK